jgi:transcriptional regulator with XRE-family HTH domain
MRRRNVTGRRVAYLRSEQNMTQDTLAARLQCEGLDISRVVLANIESGRTEVPDDYLPYFQKALRVSIVLLFSKEVQDLNEKFVRRAADLKLKTNSRNAKS